MLGHRFTSAGRLLRRWSAYMLLMLMPSYATFAATDTGKHQAPLSQLLNEPFRGDLAAMRSRGLVRVLVSYNRTNYFLRGAQAHGFEYELMEQYRKFLNRDITRDRIRTEFVFIPVPFDRLIPSLVEGKGDIIAAGFTVTEQRGRRVAFSKPYLPGVRELLVTGSAAQPLTAIEDLSGRQVHVLRGSSYAAHLTEVNGRLRRQELAPIEVLEVDENLQTEDLLELVNAGVIEFTVADEHIAEIWSKVLPGMRVQADIVINDNGNIAWAVRKSNPRLLASLNQFVAKHQKGTLLGNMLFKRYYRNSRWIENPTSDKGRKRFEAVAKLFQKYAGRYGFDWLKIVAQAYQESGLDHSKKNPSGAVGIMQVKHSTAADKQVGIERIDKLEHNIHAGVKYLAFVRDRYFSDPAIASDDQAYFSFAAYNAGPGKVRRMRELAVKMGLDANRWFSHVESAALRIVGQETVRYVRNILKYYTAYRLSLQNMERRRTGREALCQQADGPDHPSCRETAN